MLGNAQPKPRPKLLEKRQAVAEIDRIDRAERRKCHDRSNGFCEVRTMTGRHKWEGRGYARCGRVATENHHLIGGLGRRNRGESIKAEHRLDVCKLCHSEITHHVLLPVDGTKAEDAATVRYERVR